MEYEVTRVTAYVVTAESKEGALEIFNARYRNGLSIKIVSEYFEA